MKKEQITRLALKGNLVRNAGILSLHDVLQYGNIVKQKGTRLSCNEVAGQGAFRMNMKKERFE